jgi:16S rRNA (cytosine967-C5)-methyltransferase
VRGRGEHAADLCAGAGGKTLALAAAMEGRGQIMTDSDKRRLAPIHARIEGGCAQHSGPHALGQAAPLDELPAAPTWC